MCPFLKFVEQNSSDEEQMRFQLDINNDNIDFAERLGVSKTLNKKIMPDSPLEFKHATSQLAHPT